MIVSFSLCCRLFPDFPEMQQHVSCFWLVSFMVYYFAVICIKLRSCRFEPITLGSTNLFLFFSPKYVVIINEEWGGYEDSLNPRSQLHFHLCGDEDGDEGGFWGIEMGMDLGGWRWRQESIPPAPSRPVVISNSYIHICILQWLKNLKAKCNFLISPCLSTFKCIE